MHLKSITEIVSEVQADKGSLSEVDEMSLILKNVKRAKVDRGSRYTDLRFIHPTSNTCERLFSLSKLTLADNRKRLLPENVEMQLFLKMNAHLWSMDLFQESLQE